MEFVFIMTKRNMSMNSLFKKKQTDILIFEISNSDQNARNMFTVYMKVMKFLDY